MNKKVKNIFRSIPVVYPLWHKMRLKRGEIREKQKKAAFDKYAMEILSDIMKMASEKNYTCFCEGGTLLGIVRDRHLIPWDDDLDLWIVDNEKFSWIKFERDMVECGFWKYREIEYNGKVITHSYKKKNVLVDISIWPVKDEPKEILLGVYQIPGYIYENGKLAKYRVWKFTVPPITGIESVQIDNIDVKIPANAGEILAAIYGNEWMIPDPEFVPAREDLEAEYKFTYYHKPLHAH